jgi:hypothetical protein
MALVRFGSAETGALASTYFGWIEDISDSLMMISVKILDGNRLWDGVLGVENKPHSRRQETNREFFNLLKDSLSEINESKYDYSFQSPGNGILSLVIKERMAEMSALIARYDFVSSSESGASLSSLYQSIYGLISNKDETIRCLTKEIQSNRVALDTLSQEHIQNTQNREAFQRDFFTKFCLIVNSKKDEIKRLCGEVNQSKEQIESLKAQLTALQEQNLRSQALAMAIPVSRECERGEVSEIREKPKLKKAVSRKRAAPRYTKGTPSQTQSSESKSYLSDEEEAEDEDGGGGSDTYRQEKRQTPLEGDSLGDPHTARISGRKKGKNDIKPDPDRAPLLDPSQDSQILPPRGVEVGSSRDLDRILSHSSSQHGVAPAPREARHKGEVAMPAVKEEKQESLDRITTQLTASQYVPAASLSSLPPSSMAVPAPSRGAAVKPMTRVRQMFGGSSSEEDERPQKKVSKKRLQSGGDDDDLLNYM